MQRKIEVTFLHLLGYRDPVSIGQCYFNGKYVKKNNAIALAYFYEGLRKEDNFAYYMLSRLSDENGDKANAHYLMGAYNESRYLIGVSTAIEDYTKAAEQHTHIPSMLKLAALYSGKLEDKGRYYRRAANKDKRSIKNRNKEIFWYKKAAILYDKTAIHFFDVEKNNDPLVALTLADMYKNGEIGKHVDISHALENYYLAAKDITHAHHAPALAAIEELQEHWSNDFVLKLATLYCDLLLPPEKIIYDLKKLADNDYPGAQSEIDKITLSSARGANFLASLYEREHPSVFEPANRDYAKAIKYYLRACKNRCHDSLNALIQLRDYLSDSDLLELGKLYRDVFKREIDALTCFNQLAKKNITEAKNALDELVNQSPHSATLLAKMRIDEGDSQSASDLYIKAAIRNQPDALKYIKELEQTANSGDPQAQFILGANYYFPINQVELAISWCLRAVAAEYEPAKAFLEKTAFSSTTYNMIADHYENGVIVKKDLKEAIRNYRLGANQNNPESYYRLALLYENNKESGEEDNSEFFINLVAAAKLKHEKALETLTLLSKNGDHVAQYYLGAKYYHTFRELEAAIKWCLLSSENGYLPAIDYFKKNKFLPCYTNRIGKKYESGDGVKRNIHKAIEFYLKGAADNDMDSYYLLGELCLGNDEIIKGAEQKAFDYFLVAAQLGHPDAFTILESLGHSVPPNAQIALGKIYQAKPFGNNYRACFWYQQAADGGNVEATQCLSKLN